MGYSVLTYISSVGFFRLPDGLLLLIEFSDGDIKSIECTFTKISPITIHPQTSLPQIHLDQLFVMEKSHHEACFHNLDPLANILQNNSINPQIGSTINTPVYPGKLTCKFLLEKDRMAKIEFIQNIFN